MNCFTCDFKVIAQTSCINKHREIILFDEILILPDSIKKNSTITK